MDDEHDFNRVPCDPYIQELRHWQEILSQPRNVEPNERGQTWGLVNLDEVEDFAQKWEADWRNRQHDDDIKGV